MADCEAWNEACELFHLANKCDTTRNSLLFSQVCGLHNRSFVRSIRRQGMLDNDFLTVFITNKNLIHVYSTQIASGKSRFAGITQ